MHRICATLIAFIAVTVLAIPVMAHGNEQHVIGFVASISGNEITVKTMDKKEVTVTATEKTEFYEGKARVSIKELKVGDRVVIHAVKKELKLVAHTVRFAPATGGTS